MQSNKKKVAACTLGCKVNMYDTEAMLEIFKAQGYEITEFDSFADVYIVNTCTVTNLGDKKSRQMIRRAKRTNPNAIIAAVGCYSQVAPEEVSKIEGVSLVLGTKDRKKIVEMIEQFNSGYEEGIVSNVSDVFCETDFEELMVSDLSNRCRAFLKIQEGCDRFCSFCIIPYARGRVRSRKPEMVIEEARKLAENGYKEIVLAGIHVASYGKDLKDISLIEIIEKVHEIDGLERIRMSSVEPLLIDQSFVGKIKKLPKLCDHFHLSLQSGSDKILRKMNRKYTKEQYRQAVALLKETFPSVALTTDVIVGFPGETEEDFWESYEFIRETELSRLHVFPYSAKKGTPAAGYEDQIPQKVKNDRSKKMTELSNVLNEKFFQRFLNNELCVLFEKKVKNDIYEGHSTNYIPVRVRSNLDLTNKIFDVRAQIIEDDYIWAEEIK